MGMLVNPFYVAPGGAVDPNFGSVVALLHFDNNLTNFASHGTTWAFGSPANGAGFSSTSPLFGTDCGIFPQSGGVSKATSNHADYAVGSGDFTLEFAYWVASHQDSYMLEMTNALRIDPSNGATGKIYVEVGGTILIGNSASAVTTLNAWNRAAVSRTGSTMYFYFNGTFINSSSAGGASTNFSGTDLCIGTSILGGFPCNCRIDEYRLTKGVDRYGGANYTLAAAAFPDS